MIFLLVSTIASVWCKTCLVSRLLGSCVSISSFPYYISSIKVLHMHHLYYYNTCHLYSFILFVSTISFHSSFGSFIHILPYYCIIYLIYPTMLQTTFLTTSHDMLSSNRHVSATLVLKRPIKTHLYGTSENVTIWRESFILHAWESFMWNLQMPKIILNPVVSCWSVRI